MRKIFPENNDIIGLQDESTRPVTQQDLVNLQNQIEQVATDLSNAVNNLENYKTSQSQHISTDLIDTANAVISTLQAASTNLSSANIGTLTVSQLSELSNLVANVAAFTTMTATNATVTNDLTTNKITSNDITVDALKATNAQITNWSISNLGVDSVIANTINTQNVNTTNILSENENTQNLNVSTKATIKEADVEKADISGLTSDKINTSVINWKDYTTIVDPDVYYIKVPHFTNGHYFIEGRSNGEKLYNIEITNSLSNYTINWGKKDDQKWIEKVYIDETLGNVWIKANTLEKTIDLYYANINADCNESPATYNSLSITPDETYPIVYRNGNKFFGPVDLMDNRNFEPLDLIPTSNYSQATTDSVHYTVTEPEEIRIYKPDQSLNTDDSVEFYDTSTTFLNVEDFRVPPTFVASKLQDDTTLDLASFDDGALIAFRKNGQSYVYQKRTDSLSQPVLYPVATTNGMPVVRTNIPVAWDPDTKSLVESRIINVDELSVGRVDGDLHVTGDLTVDGTTHTVDVEEVAATGDILTLRANNSNSLASNQISGVVVNKYNGQQDLALGTSSDGTLRVGTAAGTDVSYTNIALKHEDNSYYSYDNLLPPNYTLLSPQPLGTMTSWTGKAEVEGYTKYATAVFTQIDITTMQPILTRNESSNMTGAMPLVWDAANNKAITRNATRSHQIFETDDNGNPSWRNREDVSVGNAANATNADNLGGLNSLCYMHFRTSDGTLGGTTATLQTEIVNNGSASPCCGSYYITDGPAGETWYNFIYVSHRNGIGQDNYLYGTLIVFLMTGDSNRIYIKHLINGTWYNWQQVHAVSADDATNATNASITSKEVAAGTAESLVYAKMAGSDFFRIHVGGANEQGYAEIATADDGNEPIYVRQYYVAGSDYFNTVAHEAVLLDGSGNTSFPGTVTAPSFNGVASQSVLTQKIRVGNTNPTVGDIWVD